MLKNCINETGYNNTLQLCKNQIKDNEECWSNQDDGDTHKQPMAVQLDLSNK